jgi:hypothetical protein
LTLSPLSREIEFWKYDFQNFVDVIKRKKRRRKERRRSTPGLRLIELYVKKQTKIMAECTSCGI